MHEFRCICPTAIFRVLDVGQLTVHIAPLRLSRQEDYQALQGTCTWAARGVLFPGEHQERAVFVSRASALPGSHMEPTSAPARGHRRCGPRRGGRASRQLLASRQQGPPWAAGGALPGLPQPCFERAVGLETSRTPCQPELLMNPLFQPCSETVPLSSSAVAVAEGWGRPAPPLSRFSRWAPPAPWGRGRSPARTPMGLQPVPGAQPQRRFGVPRGAERQLSGAPSGSSPGVPTPRWHPRHARCPGRTAGGTDPARPNDCSLDAPRDVRLNIASSEALP